MSVPVFTFQLRYEVLPGLVTVGKYDGSHSCLTVATTGDKILIHSPHKYNREISFLNVSEKVTALCSGKLKPDEDKDILVIGSPSSVLVYHVDNNSELFFKEIPDGVSAITIGNMEGYSVPLLIIGGNCSIQGFDWRGQELYWTVTGDSVRSLALIDVNYDGYNELVVGSDDFEIRVFKQDSMIYQSTEIESVISLVNFKDNKYGFGLANGTFGIYEKFQRIWRIKSKSLVRCMCAFDLNGDGIDEMVIGWASGKLDVRSIRTAEVVYEDKLNDGIAGIVSGDYKRAGKNQLIVVTESGEVRGYDSTSLERGTKIETSILRDLFQHKQNLLSKLRNWSLSDQTSSGTPANTKLAVLITPIIKNDPFVENHILLTITTNTNVCIRSVSIFAEGLFDGETFAVHPKIQDVCSILKIPLYPPRDIPVNLDVKAFVGSDMNYDRFHVFHHECHLPRFSMYLLIPFNAPGQPQSYVNFPLSERTQRLDLWLKHNFIVPDFIPVKCDRQNDWRVAIKSLRDGSAVNIKYKSGTVTLVTENMSLAADLIQSIANYLNLEKLESYAQFPKIFNELESLLEEIKNLRQNSSKISATIANSALLIRSLTVQAEDSRLLSHMKDMKEYYVQLNQVNEEMSKNHKLNSNNHEQLLRILRNINMIIQHTSRMRVDKNTNELVSECRKAVAENNINILVKLIKTGHK